MKGKTKAPRDYDKQAWKYVEKADYSGALKIAKRCLKEHPFDFQAKALYASILGDYAEFLRPPLKYKVQTEAIQLLRELTARLRGQDARTRRRIKDEFYWQTKQYRKQYMLGCSEVKKGSKEGYYGQGVGAAWYAKSLYVKGQISRAGKWAKRSVTAWERFLKYYPSYYNSYVHYALASGILGYSEKAEALLTKAAKLSHRPKNFSEFEDIRKILEGIYKVTP